MVDPLKYSYYLVLVTEKKKKYDITNFVEDLGWEELENELAAKLSCTVKNDKTKGQTLQLDETWMLSVPVLPIQDRNCT